MGDGALTVIENQLLLVRRVPVMKSSMLNCEILAAGRVRRNDSEPLTPS